MQIRGHRMIDDDAGTTCSSIYIPEDIIDWVRDSALAVDSGSVEARKALPHFADAALVSLGAPLNREGGLLPQAAVILHLASVFFIRVFAVCGVLTVTD